LTKHGHQDRQFMSTPISERATDNDADTGGEETLTARAYRLLREDILSGHLAPGLKLRIETLRNAYGIGASPLREALSRLVADGLVDNEERRGFRIPAVSLADLRDIADMRQLLECAALRQAIERGDETWEASVVAAFHRLTRIQDRLDASDPDVMSEWEEQHRLYHEALVTGAGSRWLKRLQRTLYDQFDRYRRLYLPRVSVPPNVQAEHQKILDATLARDADAACRELAEHIEQVYAAAERSDYFATTSAGPSTFSGDSDQ
jgi:GntR family carbon starvation induced transcriptional regulator